MNSLKVESIFGEADERRIAPQNFQGAILACVVYIVQAYVSYFTAGTSGKIIFLCSFAIGLAILVSFRAYLHNFRAAVSIRWVNVHITLYSVVFALYFMSYLYPSFLTSVAGFGIAVHFFLKWRMIVNIIIFVGLGVSLQGIPGDPIDLLLPLGRVYVYLLPLVDIWRLGIVYSQQVRAFIGGDILLVRLAITTISLIPTLMLIAIFYRAMNYVQRRNI